MAWYKKYHATCKEHQLRFCYGWTELFQPSRSKKEIADFFSALDEQIEIAENKLALVEGTEKVIYRGY